jgi:hypothetical protein
MRRSSSVTTLTAPRVILRLAHSGGQQSRDIAVQPRPLHDRRHNFSLRELSGRAGVPDEVRGDGTGTD